MDQCRAWHLVPLRSYSFAWLSELSQVLTNLGSVGDKVLPICTSMDMALSSLEASLMASSSCQLPDTARVAPQQASLHKTPPTVSCCISPSHHHPGVLQGPEPSDASPVLEVKVHSSRVRCSLGTDYLYPHLTMWASWAREAYWGFTCQLSSWICLWEMLL